MDVFDLAGADSELNSGSFEYSSSALDERTGCDWLVCTASSGSDLDFCVFTFEEVAYALDVFSSDSSVRPRKLFILN